MLKFLRLTILLLLLSYCNEPLELQSIENPTQLNSSLPRLFTDNTNTLFMSWVKEDGEIATLYYSSFTDEKWSKPKIVSSSGEWFVNWADFPSVIAQNGKPQAAHWLKKIPGNTYSYNIEIASFSKGLFHDAIVPHNDNTATEHGFVSMVPLSDTTFYSIWLDGRNTAGGHGEHGDLSTAMTLRGAEISESGRIISRAEIDASVCDCCNTSITKTSDGILAVYRNRTSDEIRDIFVAKFENGIWNEPVSVSDDNWEIAACPVNGPAIDAFISSVAVGWYTGAGNNPKVKLAFSDDQGNSFSDPIEIDGSESLGRVDVLMNNENSAWISWMSRTEESAHLNLKLISKQGETLASHAVSEMNPSRRSGFPQISKIENGLIIAWTDYSKESGKKIKTAILR